MKNICVFCGSKKGNSPDYQKAAKELGKVLAKNKKTLVYGGGEVGLMGEIAHSVTDSGGEVIGIIPEYLHIKEVAYERADQMITVSGLNERKEKFFEYSDAFIAMPGGFGTVDEILDVITASQLGRHNCPCLLLNTNNFFGPFIDLLNHLVKEGFAHKDHLSLIKLVSTPEEIIENLKNVDESKINKIEWATKS